MPFITKGRRKIIDKHGLSTLHLPGGIAPGDRCYLYYKEMVDQWKGNPRWGTAHGIFAKLMLRDDWTNHDDVVAASLAWEVFFIKYVMPYEDQKELEDGTI